ncbi:MAG: zinc ribbon domain-containing protein [Oscillospiraceae bacterium]|nr:zinc ribbon domain-containing protein [Oscillospiraceae bacterium]
MAKEKYIGQQCASCRAPFNKNDDIVVCPDCGTPYHRDCYKNEGKCINTLLHETGEEWKPVLPHNEQTATPIASGIATSPNSDSEAKSAPNEHGGVSSYQEEYTKHYCPICNNETNHNDAFCSKCGAKLSENRNQKNICPVCQLENKPFEVFCVRCGAPLDMEKATSQGAFFGMPFINAQQFKPESDIDGNTIDEYTHYVGGKFFSFIPKFLKFSKQGNKTSFNVWAFFFPQFYFFYRKMNGIGAASLIITILLSVPSVFEYLMSAGLISNALANNQAFINIVMIFYLLSMVFKFACGLFADWFYYSKAKKDIGKIKKDTVNNEVRKLAISSKGGTSWIGVLVASTIMVIVNIAIMMLITALNVM